MGSPDIDISAIRLKTKFLIFVDKVYYRVATHSSHSGILKVFVNYIKSQGISIFCYFLSNFIEYLVFEKF